MYGEYGPGSPPTDPIAMAAHGGHGYEGQQASPGQEMKPFSPGQSNNNMDTTGTPHVQPVHYKTNQTCSNSCNQKIICQRIKDVIGLINQMMKILSQKFQVFKDFAITLMIFLLAKLS